MRLGRLIGSILAIAFGVFLFIYGGYDDSPGAQLLGLVIAALGAAGAWKSIKSHSV